MTQPDTSLLEGLDAFRMLHLVKGPCGWRLASGRRSEPSVWDADSHRFTARCEKCSSTPTRHPGTHDCGVLACLDPVAQVPLLKRARGPDPNTIYTLCHVRLHGRVVPCKTVRGERSAVVAASASLRAVYLPDDRRELEARIGRDLDVVAADLAAYDVPVHVGGIDRMAALLDAEVDGAFERAPERRIPGVAWRFVREDFTSPYGKHTGSANTEPHRITTRPGDTVEVPSGVWASEDPIWSAREALRKGWRSLIVTFDEQDVISRGEQMKATVLRRCRVLGELTGEETCMIAVGCDPEPILARRTQAGPLFESLLPLVLEHATFRTSRLHGIDHWRAVARNGRDLAAETPGAILEVVEAFAVLHDSQRRNDGADPDHGARAAVLARTLSLPLDDAELALLCTALTDHDRGLVSDDPTIGACWTLTGSTSPGSAHFRASS